MILKQIVDILMVEFCVDTCQDKIVDNVFTDQWIVWQWWFCLNEKELEHKLEHGMNQIVDISELKPKLKTSWNQDCKRKLW